MKLVVNWTNRKKIKIKLTLITTKTRCLNEKKNKIELASHKILTKQIKLYFIIKDMGTPLKPTRSTKKQKRAKFKKSF